MRRVRRKGASKDKVFGCDLLEHLNASGQDIPQVLRCCSQFVEERGVVDGIYRLSGVSSNIQKLRSEFESDGTPDLSKEVYLQDIHCVSSLCKAYFRELPNPLLTYQLYDKFAEAVAVQLEEDRLVKIQDVLKELPTPHYRTLEFLMCHLVKMASYSAQTNMHARNLAIVWAPNLLRSKDIEVSGFNGTAAFMEVRVQSIVVEFILTHVPQLFPEPSVECSRRKSLPSPIAISGQEELLFKAQPPTNFGHISPGDGPLPMRPYHAIIEGTDKRKGSFKGRKWMSIFNIGSRFHDPRRRHKHSAKEKDTQVLRPARSMDSLSIASYSNEDCIRPLHTSRSAKMSVLEVASSPSPLSGSEYAVTYRRGTGVVSGGTQGTYTALDAEGSGSRDGETVQTRSPGLSTKGGRRAAMHITGPTVVTVPLHITSNLALGLLQGGGSNRVVHRGRDKEGGHKGERKDNGRMEMEVEELGKGKEEKKEVTHGKETVTDEDANAVVDKEEDENEEAVGGDCTMEPAAKETCAKSLIYNVAEDVCQQDYEDMQGEASAGPQENNVFDSSEVLNSTQLEQDDQELSGYVQDNFEFLDHMDCSVSCQIPLHFLPDCASQVNEFSVEPPGHSDDEYELMVQPSHHAAGPDTSPAISPEINTQSQLKFHRPCSVDANERHGKSLSLPHMTSPVCEPGKCCSGNDDSPTDDDTTDYGSSDEDDSLFVKSLPADFFLSNSCDLETNDTPTVTVDATPQDHSCEVGEFNPEFSPCEQQNNGEENQDNIDREEETIPRNEERVDHSDDNSLRDDFKITEDGPGPLPLEVASHHCEDLQTQEHTDGSSIKANDHVEVEKVKQEEDEEVHHFSIPGGAHNETTQEQELLDVSEETIEDFKTDQDDGEKEKGKGTEDVIPEIIISTLENVSTEDGKEPSLGRTQEESLGMDDTVVKIWDELEEVVCEVIEDEERKTVEVRHSGEDNKTVTTWGKNPEDTEINLPERCGQDGEVIETLVSKEDEPILEEVTEMPSLRSIALKAIKSEIPESREGVSVDERGPERYVQELVTELLVPKDKVILEEVTVNRSLRNTSLKEVRSDVPDSGGGMMLEAGIPERYEQEDTVTEKLVHEEEHISEEVAVMPNLRATSLKEVKSNILDSREGMRFDNGGPERSEQVGTITENLAHKENKDISEEETMRPSLSDTLLKEVRSDVPESREEFRFEEQGTERCEQEGTVKELFVAMVSDPPLEEDRPDVPKSSKGLRFEEQGTKRCEQKDRGIGRKLVISKMPNVYQVKAVPVVPPKPQHCMLAARTLRQQQQQREKRDPDGPDDVGPIRDSPRNSPVSICFDEAVAIATMRREKERGSERERQRDWMGEVQ
ncbi:rho GTPase-activating protein 30 [Syngnathoides biaculeatus]|uniref:rho GTPase-activating protein 30 n=1 Tax=Syngnathoides biaculeatus TaxID=300417 RepID=UPI002ADDD00B|nr:rho GTPase-activating protein 30 [Syngnathoides biaculeatus]